MMVCHHHGHAEAFGVSDLLQGADAVVAGHNGVCICRQSQVDQFFADAVSVFHPVRNIHIHTGPCAAKANEQNIGGTDAVNIVIPDDPDLFSFPDLMYQNVKSCVHSL